MPGENVYDWSTTASANGTADSGINWQEGMARAAVNDSARSELAAIAKFRRLLTGVITTTGSANAQEFVSGVGYTAIPTGLRVLLKLGFKNTGPATLNMDGIGPVDIKDDLGNALNADELPLDSLAEFCYDGTNWILLNAPAITLTSLTESTTSTVLSLAVTPRGYIDGLTLSYASTTSISVAVGQATDSGGVRKIPLAAPITKTTAVWAVGTGNGGLDTGAIAANTWYHVWLIQRSDADVVDILFSTSATAPTMPTNYDFKRRIGSCKTDGSSLFYDFFQVGDFFTWKLQKQDFTGQMTAYTTVTLSTPKDVQCVARLQFSAGSDDLGQGHFVCITPGMAESGNNGIVCGVWYGQVNFSTTHTVTGTASDVRCCGFVFGGGVVNWTIYTNGWLDPRGRDA